MGPLCVPSGLCPVVIDHEAGCYQYNVASLWLLLGPNLCVQVLSLKSLDQDHYYSFHSAKDRWLKLLGKMLDLNRTSV